MPARWDSGAARRVSGPLVGDSLTSKSPAARRPPRAAGPCRAQPWRWDGAAGRRSAGWLLPTEQRSAVRPERCRDRRPVHFPQRRPAEQVPGAPPGRLSAPTGQNQLDRVLNEPRRRRGKNGAGSEVKKVFIPTYLPQTQQD